MLSSIEALYRLKRHSGIVPTDTDDANFFAEWLWVVRQGATLNNAAAIWNDLLDCFDSLNQQFNGDFDPEASMSTCTQIPRETVYAVSGILNSCIVVQLNPDSSAHPPWLVSELKVLAWKIGCAWDSVLAGDIDDIRTHVNTEFELIQLSN